VSKPELEGKKKLKSKRKYNDAWNTSVIDRELLQANSRKKIGIIFAYCLIFIVSF